MNKKSRKIVFRYTAKKPNGHIVIEYFPLRDIWMGYAKTWFYNNGIGADSEITIEQYTGIIDINGRRIFEGDRVKYDAYYYGDSGEKGTVVFAEGRFFIDKEDGPEINSEEVQMCRIEVIS